MADETLCKECGAVVTGKGDLCPDCAIQQVLLSNGRRPDRTASRQKDRIAAALLAFFVGGIGVHRFYLDEVATGFVYLVFCWTLIPAILGIIEAVVFWRMNDARFHELYG